MNNKSLGYWILKLEKGFYVFSYMYIRCVLHGKGSRASRWGNSAPPTVAY